MSERISQSPSSSQSPTHAFLQAESNMQKALQDRDQTIQRLQSEVLRYRLQELGGGELVLDFSGMTTPPDIENTGRTLKTKREIREGKRTDRQMEGTSQQPVASPSTSLLPESRLPTNYQATSSNNQHRREAHSIEHHKNQSLNQEGIEFLQKLLKIPLTPQEIQILVQSKPNVAQILNEISFTEDLKIIFIIGYALSFFGIALNTLSISGPDSMGSYAVILFCCSFSVIGFLIAALKMDEKKEKLINRLKYDGFPV